MNLHQIYRSWSFILTLFFAISLPVISHSTPVVRAAIDVGSGGPKLRVAEIDPTTNKILNILFIKQYPVIFQESLLRNDKKLSSEIMVEGLNAIKNAMALAKSYGAEGVAVIGTSVFRNATNGQQFAEDIQREIGQKIHVLDQDLEAKLAFQAALTQIDTDPENLVVWDIGGGSTQFIGMALNGNFLIDGSNQGSGSFRDYIIESIQQRPIKDYRSPNPISSEQAVLAENQASILSTKVNQVFRNKISQSTTKVVGVGSVFGRGIGLLLKGKNPFTIEDLEKVVETLVGKTDTDLGGGDFACIEVSNALLALGFMKGLSIKQMYIIDVNNADGAMGYPPFW